MCVHLKIQWNIHAILKQIILNINYAEFTVTLWELSFCDPTETSEYAGFFFFFSVLSRRWNSQTSGPLASSGPQNTPVLHHRCLTFGFSLSLCTTLNIALFYLAKCRLTGHPVTCQRCGTILSSDCREPKFFSQLVSGSAVTMRQLQGETSHSYF